MEKLTQSQIRKSCSRFPYFDGSAPTSAVAQRWDHRLALNVDHGGPTWPMEGSGLGLRRTHPLIGRNNDSAEAQFSRHEAQKHEEGYRWCPRRARNAPDTREGLLSLDCTNLLGLGAFLCGLPGCSLMLAV